MGLLEIARDFAVANWDNAIMWVIGGILIYLAIKKDMEPTLFFCRLGFRRDHCEPAGFRNCGGRRNHPHSLRLRHCKRIFPAGAFHRHRCNDRLRPRADQPETYAFRCGGAVRHIFHALHGNPLRVRSDGIRFHCDNRRGGRPDKHCCCKPPRHQCKRPRGFCECDRCCGTSPYGSCSDYTATSDEKNLSQPSTNGLSAWNTNSGMFQS